MLKAYIFKIKQEAVMTYGKERIKAHELVKCNKCGWQNQRKYLVFKPVFIDIKDKVKPEYMASYWACPICGEKILD
jgi:predicted RNA-binding Zn-ribbon protein involved in translation (DUF1610 family)